MASSMSATSATVRPIGPSTARSWKVSRSGPLGMRPGLGRRPTTALKPAGVRRLPPRSEPWASQAVPVASATAAPPEEPAALIRVSHGLRVTPKTGLKVLAPAPNSGVLDLA